MAGGSELLGPFRYTWTPECFPLGRDSLALGAFATVRRNWKVCDLGCGGGLLLLLLARREAALSLTGVELEPHAAAAARENLRRNHLDGEIFEGDLSHLPPPPAVFDLVISNPPYFAPGSGAQGGSGRMESTVSLEALCRRAGELLRPGGRFALVHRPERLADLVSALRKHRLEPKRLQFLQHDSIHPPSALLLESVKCGKPGLTCLPAAFAVDAAQS